MFNQVQPCPFSNIFGLCEVSFSCGVNHLGHFFKPRALDTKRFPRAAKSLLMLRKSGLEILRKFSFSIQSKIEPFVTYSSKSLRLKIHIFNSIHILFYIVINLSVNNRNSSHENLKVNFVSLKGLSPRLAVLTFFRDSHQKLRSRLFLLLTPFYQFYFLLSALLKHFLRLYSVKRMV